MIVLPPINRRTLRGINAQGRRFAAKLGACSYGCPPAQHPLDGVSGRTGLGKYAGITAALGAALQNDDLIRASRKQDEAPPLLRRVSTISAVIAMAATEKPRDQWYRIIGDVTTLETAATVRKLAAKMPIREEDGVAYSLALVLLHGAIGEKAGQSGDSVIAYRKAMAAFDAAMESIRRKEVLRAGGASKLAGLGAAPAGFWSDPANTARGYKEATGYFPQPVRLDLWVRDNQSTNRDYAAFVQIVKNNADDKRGVWGVGSPNECKETIKSGKDWITEDCEVNATDAGDTAARLKKIDLVRRAFTQATGLQPTACDINYYTQYKYCTLDTYLVEVKKKEAGGRPAPTQSDKVRGFSDTAAGQAAKELATDLAIGKQIIEAFLAGNISEGLGIIVKILGDIGKTASQFLCSAINLVFKDKDGRPTPAGQVLCAIITFLVGGIFDQIRGGVAIGKAIFDGLGKFFTELGKGNPKEAGKALVEATNVIVLILLAGNFTTLLGLPMVDQELTPDQRAKGYKSIESLAKDLGFDFTVGLIAAGLGVIFTGPTPVNISAVATAVSPAVVLVLAPVLKNDPRSPESIRNSPLEVVKKGIDALVKIGAMVVVNVMNIQDVFVKFATALQRYIMRVKANPDVEWAKVKRNFEKEFDKQWNEFKAKVSNGNFDQKVAAVKGLVGFLPDLLVAVAMDDPDLAQVYLAGKKIFEEAKKTYAQAKQIWEDAMRNEPDERLRIKAMRDSLNTVKAQLDVLCQRYPDDPNCKFPKDTVEKIVTVEKVVEKPVIVEKVVEKQVVVYRDREPSAPPASSSRPTPSAPAPSAPAPSAPKKGGAAPLVLAAGGFAVGGPVGAAIGLVVGLAASK